MYFSQHLGQAETFVHGLTTEEQSNWENLLEQMELRFGHSNMKESYIAEGKLKKNGSLVNHLET